MQLPLRGLYAITDNKLIKTEKLIDTVEQAIIGGAKIIQYRDKSNKRHFEQAQALSYISKKYQVPLLINDDVALALHMSLLVVFSVLVPNPRQSGVV